MAEKPEDQFSSEEKIAKAKELYARGCRNYYVKSYSEAADDLSEVSKLYGEEYGIDGDELGEVYLMYAKSLVAIGQDENKVIDVPEEDEDDEEEEPIEEDDGESAESEAVKPPETNGTENGKMTNGHSEKSAEEPQAGPSTGANEEDDSSNDVQEVEDTDDGGNLELAWEVLLNAAAIFERQGPAALTKLMDVFIEMAGISLENGNFEVAIKDFNRALDVFLDLEDADQNQRIAAEVNYKIGLCHSASQQYDESVKSFQKAADLLSEVITSEKAREEQTEAVLATIKDLDETRDEILAKMVEIGDIKTEEVEKVKKELAKLFGPGESSSGAGSSSSSAPAAAGSPLKSQEADKPKPMDISHLIKRKKPDTEATDVTESPAKKKAVETSPTAAAPIVEAAKEADEATTVKVIDN